MKLDKRVGSVSICTLTLATAGYGKVYGPH
jgi:hypothetical protein